MLLSLVSHVSKLIVACTGDDTHKSELRAFNLEHDQRHSLELPGQPRGCVTEAAGTKVFLAIRQPSLVLVATLPELREMARWPIPVDGAHGLEIDHQRGRLYVACAAHAVVEIDAQSGAVLNTWRIAGGPDVTFVNPATGLVHVAIGKPGLVQSIDPRNDVSQQTSTGPGAHTTAIVAPDRLYVFSSTQGGALVYEEPDHG